VSRKKFDKLLSELDKADVSHVKVGVLLSKGGSATTPEGISMVELAGIHEFGAPNAGIPERSFIRSTFARGGLGSAGFRALSEKLSKAIVTGKISVAQAYEMFGSWGAGQVKATITEGPGVPPPLKPATIKRKKSDRPLVDTGSMKNSISYEVVRK
jgi:hypothetical protein